VWYSAVVFKPNYRISAKTIRKLLQIEELKTAVEKLPITLSLLKSLRETALLNSTHYSTQIEGNLLTLPEVAAVKAGKRIPERERDETEVRNHFAAFALMEKLAKARQAVRENDIKYMHGLVMIGKMKSSAYRAQQNVIRESGSGRIVYLPPEPKDVAKLTQELVQWINLQLEDGDMPVPIIAAIAHYQFATIHPYMDGNGRMARLLATLILRGHGYDLKGIYSLDEHYAKDLASYYRALTVGSHNYYGGRAEADVSQFVDYFCAGLEDAFRKVSLAAARDSKKQVKTSSASVLRDLDPRLRRLLPLFESQGSASVIDMAKHLKMSPRTLNDLVPKWVKEGFLDIQNPSRKARSYQLSKAILGEL
jgi:Fic family protein